jgi:hypothetical protein
MSRELPETAAYSRVAILASALVGIVLAIGSVWLTTFLLGGSNGSFYESLFRVGPTVQGGGVGADWTAGNTIPALDFLVALVHAADVILGIFILVLVFIHWAAFRRLASRMRRPGGEARGDRVATDGGQEAESGRAVSDDTGVDAEASTERTQQADSTADASERGEMQ